MSANDKAAAAFHPADDEFAEALVGENPCIPPFMDRAMALAGPNARSAAAAVFDAIAATDDAVKHAKNLQAAVNDLRRLHAEEPCQRYANCNNPRGRCFACRDHMPCPTIAILERHGV